MAATIYSRYWGLQPVTVLGVVSLAQRPMPPAQDYPDALQHRVVASETLDQLAFKYYGREDLWWRIADANGLSTITDCAPGDSLIVPPLRVATRAMGR
jgi:nucleoid-associated protein YgaU